MKKRWSRDLISNCSYSRIYAFNRYTIIVYLHYSKYLMSTYLAPGSMLSALCRAFTSFNPTQHCEVITSVVPVLRADERWWLMALSRLPESSESVREQLALGAALWFQSPIPCKLPPPIQYKYSREN